MKNLETVENASFLKDPLIRRQKEDVAKMRTSLLACSEDPQSSIAAMKNITVLRVYHQIAQIIRYLEMMDKIEAKLYETIDYSLENMDITNEFAWTNLMNMQERLQKVQIESQKLLQPYLNIQELNLEELTSVTTTATSSGNILPKESRDKLRFSAQQILAVLDQPGVADD